MICFISCIRQLGRILIIYAGNNCKNHAYAYFGHITRRESRPNRSYSTYQQTWGQGNSQSDILKRFSKAIINSGSITLDHRLRLVERLVNKGMLGEFLKDKVVTWFAQQVKLDSFTALLAPWVGILQSKNKAT